MSMPPREVLRAHAEHANAAELTALARLDERQRPPGWRLSPWAVVTFVLGGRLSDGTEIVPKYIGDRRLIEIAVATLATDRALLLLGVPGTAKSWLSEHLAAAVSGDSTLLVQGTAGTGEEAIRYGWNYARLLADGPSRAAAGREPGHAGMGAGKVVRVEELTRIPSDVQDALITILSEKSLPIAELGEEVQAVKGFNVIATANNRDRGVNELSSALKRRFNTVVLPLPVIGRGGGRDRPPARGGAGPRARAAGRAAGARGDPPDRDDLPRAPLGPDRGRQEQAQVAFSDALDGRGDRGRQPRACRWRRTSATGRCRRATWRPG